MSIVNIDPKSGNFPYLRQGGKYGAGMENEAEVVVSDLDPNVTEAGKGPGYDKDCERGAYIMFVFRVTEADQVVYLRDYQSTTPNSGSKALRFLESLGVPVDDAGNFDTDNVVGKACILEVGPPGVSAKTGNPYSGRLKDVIGV